MKTIELKFDSDITHLAGHDYGIHIYYTQVRDLIDLTGETTIIFPDQIKAVAIGFVQGFIGEIVDRIGFEGLHQAIKIKCKSDELQQDIIDRMY